MASLQSITVQGFKTFPDKVNIHVPKGVTAIVGPNGSGKSNIGEAMRWVLGEQSARALRCEKKMEEIIFHGTEQRAALGYCEVSLLLGNEDGVFGEGDDIRITRRIYRSGESEYYLNKAACRLKDVQTMLMDTGLGPGGYSIIRQGMIDQIMSEKPADRRKVFEEAAGIAKFRSRKEESERKLVRAEQNLLRVSDKIDELTPRVESLQRQSERAKQFLILRDELRGHEINLWLHDLDLIRQEKTKARTGFEQTTADLRAGEAELTALRAAGEEMDAETLRAAAETERLRTHVHAAEETAHRIERDRSVAAERLSHLREQSAVFLRETDESAAERQALETRCNQTRTALRALDMNISAKEADLTAAKDEQTRLVAATTALEARRTALDSDIAAAARAREDAGLRLSSEEAQMNALHERREAIRLEQEEDAAARTDAQSRQIEAAAALDQCHTTRDELQNVVSGYKLRLDKRQNRALSLKNTAEDQSRRLHETASRVRILQDLAREQEQGKTFQTIQSVPGVHGMLSAVLSVPDELTVAVEIALGGALSHIITDRDATAKQCIALLKQHRAGRTTFYPIETMRGDEMPLPRAADASCLGVASRLVSCDTQYAGIVRRLLGRTLICKTLDDAVALSRREGGNLRIVTLDGQLVNPGGSLTGGSVGQKIGVLSRKNELARLQATHTKDEAALAATHAELRDAERTLQAAQYELDVATEEHKQAEAAVTRAEANLHLAETFLAHAEENAAARDAEHRAALERLSSGKTRAEEEQQTVRKAEMLLLELEQQRGVLAVEDTALRTAGGVAASHAAALREALAAARAEERGLREREEELCERIALISGSEDDRNARETALGEEINRLTAEIDRLHTEAAARTTEIAALQAELTKRNADALAREQQRGVNHRAQSDRADQNLALTRLGDKQEVELHALEAKEDHIITALWDEYKLTLSDAGALRHELTAAAAGDTRKQIAELTAAKQKLGSVNMDAIEEYQEVEERYRYFTDQRADAVSSKQELKRIIAGIVTEMRTLFSDEFEKIRAAFRETFSEMFGGGEADLVFLDLNADADATPDVLESGVEIRACPPGKKLRSISLLSGGEQSLTAIALYFAMFKVRPAPFCVLDEIDHALDDVNVARYAAYLEKMAADRQFVVVTHRRGTMERAAALYGVTTQERGVSKILGLTLDQLTMYN